MDENSNCKVNNNHERNAFSVITFITHRFEKFSFKRLDYISDGVLRPDGFVSFAIVVITYTNLSFMNL